MSQGQYFALNRSGEQHERYMTKMVEYHTKEMARVPVGSEKLLSFGRASALQNRTEQERETLYNILATMPEEMDIASLDATLENRAGDPRDAYLRTVTKNTCQLGEYAVTDADAFFSHLAASLE